MPTINNHDEAMRFVSCNGFTASPGVPGWIVEAQRRMCAALDAIESEMEPLLPPLVNWPTKPEERADRERYPYQVRFTTNGTFVVKTKQGKTYTVEAP